MANYELGNLYYKITGDTREFDKSITSSQKSFSKVGGAMQGIGRKIAGVLATIGIAKLAKDSLAAASAAEEVNNKFGVVFKTTLDAAASAAANLSENYGLSTTKSKELLSSTGDLLAGFGVAEGTALDLSVRTQQLAVDLASFTNYSGGAEGASAALTKAMLGETESLKSLGIAINQAELKKFAEDQGLVFEEMSRGEKAALTLDLAYKQSTNSIGDFERSSASFANQQRIATSRIEDLQVAMGNQLLPVANVGITLFNDFTKELLDSANSLETFVTSAEGAAQVASVFGGIAGGLEVAKDIVSDLVEILGDSFTTIMEPFGQLQAESGNTGIAFTILGTAVNALSAGFNIAATVVGGLIENVINFVKIGTEAADVMGSIWDVITGKGSLKDVKDQFGELGEAFWNFTSGAVENVKDLVDTTVGEIATFTADTDAAAAQFQESFEKASDAIEAKVFNSLTNASAATQESNEQVIQYNTEFAEENTELYQQMWDDINTSFEEAKDARLEMLAAEEEAVKQHYQDMKDNAADALTSIQSLSDTTFSAISSIIEANYDRQMKALDAWLQAELSAKGLVEETEIERIKRELQEAIEAGDEETAALLRQQLEKEKIEENYRKKQAQLAYEAAYEAWQIQLTQAIVNTALGATMAFATASTWTEGLIGAALVAAAGAVEIATISANKPEPPSFAYGGMVMPRPTGAQIIVAENNAPEVMLNGGSEGRAFRDSFARAMVGGQGGVTINQYNTLNTDSAESLSRAAQVLYSPLEIERSRRG